VFEQYDTPVRCASGHFFTTIWMPLASLKAVRFRDRRYQRCPVGHHWATVEPLNPETADPSDLAAAAKVHDVRIP
jgi:hypothetical protein